MSYSLEQVLSWSPFIERLVNRYEDLTLATAFHVKWAEGELYDRVYNRVMDAESEHDLIKRLRVQRNWMMGRIGIRDLSLRAELEETISSTSELADALVGAALDWHYTRFCKRYGTPVGRESGEQQKMIVIGMGKLGGQELNFSSDIDMIYTYPEGGSTEGASRSISNDQFFLRLGQAVNKSLVEVTEDGFVYRVDMRLRPFGDAGPLAVTFASLEHYYEIHGRAWERYALVKARVMAGDKSKGEALFQILRPFVYRRYVDFSAMESLRELKQMIAEQVLKKGMQDNIKLGAGGIREIEFITQAFQLVHGGKQPELQGRSLMPMLKVLNEYGYIDDETQQRLEAAYRFLRTAENRLQMWNDKQTHDLPVTEHQQQAFADSLGYDSYDRFCVELNHYRDYVESQFRLVFSKEDVCDVRDEMTVLWSSELESAQQLDAGYPFDIAQKTIKAMNDFKASRQVKTLSKDGVERLNAAMPYIFKAILKPTVSLETVNRVLQVIEAIAQRSVYLVLIKENPSAVQHLVTLCQSSAWLAEMLVKYPALLDQLLDERELYSPLSKDALWLEANQVLESTGEDEERFMDQLRQWRHAQVFRVAAADVTGNIPVMHVSDYLTWIAETVLDVATEFARRILRKKNGLPGGLPEGVDRNPFMILGYGKLGGMELGYGSDLDIVFLYEGVPSGAMTLNPSGRSLDNAIYFIRMGQKIISILSSIMPSGRLYEVDMRLRPNGKSGMLVTSLDSYQLYIENKAWNWEHQALVRARAVVGDDQSKQAFEGFRSEFIRRSRDEKAVRLEVVEMRQKMQESLDKSHAERFDLKQGRGGIVDIEFMMQYLVLAHAHQFPTLADWSDNVRILEAVALAGLLPEEDVQALTDAYKVYRSKYHKAALANEKALVDQTCYAQDRANVIRIWQKLMLEGV